MRRPVLHAYVGATVFVACGFLVMVDWVGVVTMPSSALVGLGSLLLLGLISEASAFSYKVGPAGGSSSLVFLPLVAAVALFGGGSAVAFIFLTAALAEVLVRKNPPIKAAFNTAQYINATAVAAMIFEGIGGYALALSPSNFDFDPQLVPVLAFGFVALTLNHLAVGVVIAISRGERLWDFGRFMLNQGVGRTIVHDAMVMPIAVLVAFLFFELGVLGLFVALLPLIFIRYSYLANFRLEAANRDLLSALAKAIETRDPYTSGHSARVRSLSRAIGLQSGMSMRAAGELETAALLHDIGKIEVAYEDILQKPGKLTEEEWAVIRTHVDRGVEILRSLSSFNHRVIDAVRHHHELWDGSGYPDELAGEDIPLFARVIKLADAIDAMLSDRPYRRALSIEEVERELNIFSGIHFDPALVKVVLASGLLREFAHSGGLERSLANAGAEPTSAAREGEEALAVWSELAARE